MFWRDWGNFEASVGGLKKGRLYGGKFLYEASPGLINKDVPKGARTVGRLRGGRHQSGGARMGILKSAGGGD